MGLWEEKSWKSWWSTEKKGSKIPDKPLARPGVRVGKPRTDPRATPNGPVGCGDGPGAAQGRRKGRPVDEAVDPVRRHGAWAAPIRAHGTLPPSIASPLPTVARIPTPTGIDVIAPSGAVLDPDRVKPAKARLAAAGYRVRVDRDALKRHQRFAGTDAQRLAAFDRAAAAAEPIVLSARGGYGLTRLLSSLDFPALARAGKHWVGFSDFTAFHLAMLARAGAVTWAGPALIADFGDPYPPGPAPAGGATQVSEGSGSSGDEVDEDGEDEDTTLACFDDAMSGRLELLGFEYGSPTPRAVRGLDLKGTLWGGNLALVCSLLGTPYFPEVAGGILFLEDVNEHPYRMERMLTQLLLAGVLARQQAIVFGYVNGYRLGEHDAGYDWPGVLKWLARQVDVPILTGLPFGHASPKVCLPHGAEVGLATEGRQCWIVLPHGHGDHSHVHLAEVAACPVCGTVGEEQGEH